MYNPLCIFSRWKCIVRRWFKSVYVFLYGSVSEDAMQHNAAIGFETYFLFGFSMLVLIQDKANVSNPGGLILSVSDHFQWISFRFWNDRLFARGILWMIIFSRFDWREVHLKQNCCALCWLSPLHLMISLRALSPPVFTKGESKALAHSL